jgi:hypothetical protein
MMSKKPETRRQLEIQEKLIRAFPGLWCMKIHGNEYMRAGLPDLIGCVEGRFFAFEVKIDPRLATELQLQEIKWINEAGGIAAVVTSSAQAIQLIRQALARRR